MKISQNSLLRNAWNFEELWSWHWRKMWLAFDRVLLSQSHHHFWLSFLFSSIFIFISNWHDSQDLWSEMRPRRPNLKRACLSPTILSQVRVEMKYDICIIFVLSGLCYKLILSFGICLEFSKCTAASKSIDAACICIEAINGTAVEEMLVGLFSF